MDRRYFIGAGALGLATLHAGIATAGEALRMRDLYNKDISFSDLALSFEGERVTVAGFMAPPLKAEIDFFVLTKRPMAVCPFCESTTDWPDDILAIYTRRNVRPIPFNVRMQTTGTLELGAYTDPDLGFVSRVRLTNATYDRV